MINDRHDPYAGGGDAVSAEAQSTAEQQSRDLLELARHQNIAGSGEGAGTRGGNDFASKMFFGLKKRKRHAGDGDLELAAKRRSEEAKSGFDTSSSEDEYIEEDDVAKDKRSSFGDVKKKSKKDKKREKDRKRRDRSRSSTRSPRRRHDHSKKSKKRRRDRESRRDASAKSLSSSSSSEGSKRRRKKQKKAKSRK